MSNFSNVFKNYIEKIQADKLCELINEHPSEGWKLIIINKMDKEGILIPFDYKEKLVIYYKKYNYEKNIKDIILMFCKDKQLYDINYESYMELKIILSNNLAHNIAIPSIMECRNILFANKRKRKNNSFYNNLRKSAILLILDMYKKSSNDKTTDFLLN
jgi:hypothetical protein